MKKARLVSVFTALVLTSMVGVAVGCSDVTEIPPIIQTHTITFRYNYDGAENDGVYKVETVTTGASVAKPTDPIRAEMQFDYWSTEAAADSARYNFSSVIFADLDLYAQWKTPDEPSAGDVALSGIAVTHQPTTTTYTVGDTLSLAGLEVTATYSDSTTAPVTVTEAMLSGYDMSVADTYTVTVTYTENNVTKTATFTITVEDEQQDAATLSSIAVTHQPTTTTYTVGDTLSLDGLEVTATYSDESTAPVTVTAAMLSGYDMSVADTYTVTITYTENNVTKTTTFTITVEDEQSEAVTLSGIAVTHQPTTTTYTVGDTLDLTGLEVTATYSDNTTAPVTVTAAMLSGYDMSVADTYTVTITYTENNVTRTTTFTITVEDGEQPPAPVTLSGIAVTHQPTTTTYTVGDELDLDGLEVTATYSDNSTSPVTVTAAMLSGYDMSVADTYTVTVTYTVNNVTRTTTITITVEEAQVVLSGIAVTHQPTTTTYTVGDELDLDGLEVTATYSDDSTAPVTVTIAMLSGYDMNTAGSQTVTVTYTVNSVTRTTTFNITVEEAPVVLTGITVVYSDKEYYTSGTFDRDELTVTATYSEGEPQTVTDYTLSDFDMTAGTKNVTVTYVENGVTKTDTFTFVVKPVTVTKIEVTKQPTKKNYETGDALDLAGLEVTATYSDKTTETVTVTTDMLSGFNMSTVGDQTVTITYEQKTATFGIKVSKKQYTVTFNYGYDGAPNNGVVTTKIVKDGESVTPPATNPTRDDYTFKYWSTEPEGEACVAADYVISAPKTFYAVWQMFSTAEDGVYVVGSFNGWDEAFKSSNIGQYKVTKLTDNDYKISGLTLAEGYKFKFAGFTAENSYIDWKAHVYDTATIAVVPEALMTVGITSDNAKNFVINEYSASEDATWTIEFGTNAKGKYVTLRLDGYNMMRDPETGDALTGTNKVGREQAALGVAYLIGNFTDGFANVCDEWAFDPAKNSAVSLVGGKYYFQNVKLKQHDEFKVYTRTSATAQLWQGKAWAVGSVITLASSDAPNFVVPANGVYNLVYDAENGTLEIYASKTLDATVNTVPYVGDTLAKANITVTYGDDEVDDYTLITAEAVAGENNYTVVYNGAVLKAKYNAREPQVQGITVTTAPSKTYYVGDSFDKNDIVVTATYDHGSPVVLSASDFTVSAFTSAHKAAAEALTDKFNESVTVELTITHEGKTAKTTVNYKNKITSLTATLKSGKTFYVGDAISANDFYVYAVFNGKDTLKQAVTTHTVSPSTLAATTNNVTISAHNLTKNVTVSATAVVPAGITFTAPDEIPTYRSGSKLRVSDYTFTVTYNNGTTTTVTDNLTFVSDKLNSTGNTFKTVTELTENVKITVRYTEGGKTVTAVAQITVHLDVKGDTTYYVTFSDGLEHYIVDMPEQQEVRADADAISAPTAPTLKGFNFIGWKSAADGSRVTFPLKVRKDMSLVAEWEAVTYTIDYDLCYTGGVLGSGNPTSYTAEDNEFKALTLGTTARSYYTFGGWFTAAEGGSQVTEINYSTLPATGTTIKLYAHWTLVTYTLVYNVGGNGEAIDGKTFTIDTISTVATLPSTVTISATGAQSGYYFVGWYTAGEGGDNLTAVTADLLDALTGTTLTIYAQYSNEYTVTFDSNGGSDVAAAKVAYGSAVQQPANPTKAGNDFGGWRLVVDGVMQTTEYDFDTAVNGDITLKAFWRQNPKNGLYLIITYDGWATSEAILATKGNGQNGAVEYKVENIRLAEGAIFYIAQYDATGKATSYVKPSSATLGKTYINPGQITDIKFESVKDGNGYIYKLKEFNAEYNDLVWNMYVQTTQVSVELINNALRDPDGTLNPELSFDTEDKAVYIKGNFNRFNANDAWSNESTLISTATVGTKYYFTNVWLNKFDQFKMYVTADSDGWYGGATFELDEEITLKNNGADNIYFTGASGMYDLVFDTNGKKLIVQAHKDITVSCSKTTVYAGDTLAKADLSATVDGAATTIEWVESKAAQAGSNKIKLVCGNTVAEYSFTAIAVVATGIEVTTAPTNTQYYVGDTFNNAGMVVSVVYNNGSKTAISDYTVSALPAYANVSDMFTQAASVNLTITAEVDDETYTATTPIQLRNKFTGIAVDELDETPTVYVGQTVTLDDINGLTVKAVFNNNNAQTLTSGYTLSVNTATAGTVNAVVSYVYNSATYTAQFEVDVINPTLTGITVAKAASFPTQVCAEFENSFITVTASYDFGDSATVSGFTVSSVDMTTKGSKTITVSYTENGTTKTKEFTFELAALTVTFMVGDTQYETVSVNTYNSTISKPTDPTGAPSHYEFGGWTKDANGNNAWSFTADKVTEDTTLYVQWTAVDYTVTLVLGGIDGEYSVATAGNVTSITQKYSTTVTLPAVTVTNSGATRYTFLGWTLDLDAATIVYLDDEFTLDGNKTVYAHVDAVATRAFKFYNNDGTNAFTSRDVQIGVTPNAPTFNRTGYTFGGWYDNAQGTGSAVALGAVTEDTAELTELYAKWDPVPYTITFDAGDGTVTPTSLPYTVETQSASVTLPTPTRDHYDFGGWTLDGSAFTFETGRTGDITLVAAWTATTYTITFNAGAGTVTPTSLPYTVETQSVTLPTPTRDHYDFGGWKLGGNAFTFEAGRTGDITLVAAWTAKTYTLAYNTGDKGASISTTATFTAENITSVTLLATTAVTVTVVGYHVTGWYTSSVGGSKVTALTSANLADVYNGTLTLYAHYALNEYDVTFDLNYEGAAAATTVKVTHGETASAPTDDPTRTNYTFVHWYTTDEDTAFDFDTTITAPITLYVKWQADALVFMNDGTELHAMVDNTDNIDRSPGSDGKPKNATLVREYKLVDITLTKDATISFNVGNIDDANVKVKNTEGVNVYVENDPTAYIDKSKARVTSFKTKLDGEYSFYLKYFSDGGATGTGGWDVWVEGPKPTKPDGVVEVVNGKFYLVGKFGGLDTTDEYGFYMPANGSSTTEYKLEKELVVGDMFAAWRKDWSLRVTKIENATAMSSYLENVTENGKAYIKVKQAGTYTLYCKNESGNDRFYIAYKGGDVTSSDCQLYSGTNLATVQNMTEVTATQGAKKQYEITVTFSAQTEFNIKYKNNVTVNVHSGNTTVAHEKENNKIKLTNAGTYKITLQVWNDTGTDVSISIVSA